MLRPEFAVNEQHAHVVDDSCQPTARAVRSAAAGPSLLSVHDAAHVLGVTVSWVYEHLRPTASDRLPHVKLGKYVRIHPDDLAAYVDAKRPRTSDNDPVEIHARPRYRRPRKAKRVTP